MTSKRARKLAEELIFMTSIIEQIYYGNRGQGENIEMSKKYRVAAGKMADLCDNLKATLTDSQKEEFDKFCELDMEMESEAARTYFKEGFKLGILIGEEVHED